MSQSLTVSELSKTAQHSCLLKVPNRGLVESLRATSETAED